MRRVLISALIVGLVVTFVVIATGASNQGTKGTSYKIELDNAFGLVNGADFKVAGVRAGKIAQIDLCWAHKSVHCQNQNDALVTVEVNQAGFGSFKTDSYCQSRPQSLIGEYFIECQPGVSGRPLKSGSLIPVNHTGSTIPADLLNNVMRMPYRQRFALIINEFGAAVAGRSGDLQAALRRAVPALTETDNLLNLLANDSKTLQALTANSDAVITALANNSSQVQRFIVEANNAATNTAAEEASFKATWHKLPAFLEQLRPTMAKLGASTDTNLPVLQNLNAASGQLDRLFTDLPGFAHSSLPALQSLGKASVTGKTAVQAAGPTVADLNKFSRHTPELSQNLAIVGHALDDRKRAVEPDPRSPGGKGYTGLEALLQYVFNQTLAINTFGRNPATGKNVYHQLAVDAFINQFCAPYANQKTLAQNLARDPASTRQCYSWYGPNQPGVNEPDPSNPGGCVPDPGGFPPGPHHYGPSAGAPKCPAMSSDNGARAGRAHQARSDKTTGASTATAAPPGSSGSSSSGSGPPINLNTTIGNVISSLPGGGASTTAAPNSTPSTTGSGGQAKQLLNYLLSP